MNSAHVRVDFDGLVGLLRKRRNLRAQDRARPRVDIGPGPCQALDDDVDAAGRRLGHLTDDANRADPPEVFRGGLVGIVFLILMVRGKVPALWALPAGIGDVLVAVTAPWVARDVETPRGTRRAIIWNLFGMADLVVAVGLGIMTSPGPTQVFPTVPTTELMTHFPLALVPSFLVPLAFALHVISLWQLLGGPWVPHLEAEPRH